MGHYVGTIMKKSRPSSVVFACVFILLLATYANAAEFSFSRINSNSFTIELNGIIKDGDDKLLLSAIKNDPYKFLLSSSIILSSLGGSVSEAIKIAEIIEMASFMTIVNEGDTCASSCFLVLVAGQMRVMDGDILIHRPYISADSYDSGDLYETTKAHQTLMQDVRKFLAARAVPAYLIEYMMKKSSTEAYRLSIHDLIELGGTSPFFEEITIAKCGTSSQDLMNPSISPEKKRCVQDIRSDNKVNFLTGLLSDEEYNEAVMKILKNNSPEAK